jgi:hypothetical protein
MIRHYRDKKVVRVFVRFRAIIHVEGWTENDFIKHTFPNDNYEETLLNLTYFITDKMVIM